MLGLIGLPSFLKAALRAFSVFENPLSVLSSYILRKSPHDGVVRLKDGHVIYLSEDSGDIVTVFLIFARRDYGDVIPGSVVVDIGANIGVFALFAAFSGARKVYACEPSFASFELLVKNIRANRLDQIVKAKRLAVVGQPTALVKFPRSSYVMNAILPDTSDVEDYDLVPTTTLAEIVSLLNAIDLIKSDCEGAEYDIFLHANEADILKISEIRMEYHPGPWEELITTFTGLDFSVRQFMNEGKMGGGYLWLKRKGAM